MGLIKHVFKQPFITATGLAALVHSTWALGTLFSGTQPEDVPHLIGWLIPAFLIAFALDVGQIVTSAEIRQHGMSRGRATTFFVFAGATYYLQWLYIAHHMPALAIAAGVTGEAKVAATAFRDMALWIIPALLPLSTLLYTLSGGSDAPAAPVPAPKATHPGNMFITTENVNLLALESHEMPRLVEGGDVAETAGVSVEETPAPIPFGNTAHDQDGPPNNMATENTPLELIVPEPTGSARSKSSKTTQKPPKK